MFISNNSNHLPTAKLDNMRAFVGCCDDDSVSISLESTKDEGYGKDIASWKRAKFMRILKLMFCHQITQLKIYKWLV